MNAIRETGQAVMELLQIVDMAVAGGYVLALALVCLLQYMLYVFRLTEMKRQRQQDRELMEGMEGNLQEAERDRTLSRLENSILREFVSETDLDRALEMLLKRFLPDSAADCGAFLQILEDGTQQVLRSRGLTHDEANRLKLDDELLARLQREQIVTLTGEDQDRLWMAGDGELPGEGQTPPGSSVPELRRQELLLLSINDTDDLEGVMLTSRLYPAGAPRTHQLELATRLMESMAANFRQSRILRQKEYQLWSTREMLELRAITDGTYETPLKMVEAFLRCLRKQVRADRAVLYVTPASESGAAHLLADGDGSAAGGLPGDTVTDGGALELCDEVITIDADNLRQSGGDEHTGRGLVVPLSCRGQLIGRVCLSRNDRREFSRRETELAGWAAEYLSEAIHRVLSHVVVQRQALQDGLTELANRRAFDEQLLREMETARREDTPCVLLLIDLDRFKLINDEHGHQAGDAVLRNVADTLRDQVMRMRSGDRALVARYGGEELAVLLPGVPVAGARRIAEGMRAAIAGCGTEWNEQPLAVTASIGLAEFPSMAETSAELVARADAALYHAKQSGRNRVAIPTVAGSFTTGGLPQRRGSETGTVVPAASAPVFRDGNRAGTMRIAELTAHEAAIGLKKTIRHASHTRTANRSLLVCCRLDDGTTGWGEGLPRSYVTGETIESAIAQFAESDLSRQLGGAVTSWGDAIGLMDGLVLGGTPAGQRDCFGNTVRCAIELAVLDAVGRRLGEPLSRVTAQLPEVAGLRACSETVAYSGVITATSPFRERVSAWKMRLYGFGQIKVKVGAADQDDAATLGRICRILRDGTEVRIDANEAWTCDTLEAKVAPLLGWSPGSLEQPVPHAEVRGLAAWRGRLGIPLMLDESLCSFRDGERAVEYGTCDLFNLRLSKCGGFVPSLRLAALARRAGLRCQLGCQVGETGILSAAGRHFATSVGELAFLEGSYDRHLVRERLTREDLTFGYGGRATALEGAGLGVTVEAGAVEQVSRRRVVIPF